MSSGKWRPLCIGLNVLMAVSMNNGLIEREITSASRFHIIIEWLIKDPGEVTKLLRGGHYIGL